MGPRPNNAASSGKSTATKSASSFKGIDDFLEKSSVEPSELEKKTVNVDEMAKAIKEKYFEQFSPTVLTANMQQLDKCRT